jgi:hypothetical protein
MLVNIRGSRVEILTLTAVIFPCFDANGAAIAAVKEQVLTELPRVET